MKFTANFKVMIFDQNKFERVLLNELRNMNERAGKAWIDTAVNKTPIPTWSGASRATFQQLARELGTNVSIGPIRSKKSRVSLGYANSKSGVFEDGFNVGFEYTTTLNYLIYNEYNRAVKGLPPQPYSDNVRYTPYNFQTRANASWQQVASQVKLPDPYRYLKQRPL